ncbi:Zinc-type alcohol dehydrogenase-like protein C16A3.02c 4 [Colletotrichum chlorophyti]|uniref:Zinc-type alcohol dehydrogenase-like protein C16A3.02c 4 n=1 Tax=Colletotrichum chlorophyti TaxID=708187 RepID=A0A1Q8RQD6_9PEZI|nr:Zinc-type alcohol dehydrogenase-like protein C16A3.02c 4 [Colletotrichum chlorophyti]
MATANTMRAWIQKSTDVPLEKGMQLVENHPRPTSSALKPNEILVRVRCVGINPADHLFAEMGWFGKNMIKQTPLPGMDYSGEVVSTGSGITSLRAGDRVFGRVCADKGAPGTMAEFTVAELEGCVLTPDGVGFEQAAGIGTAAITAYESLVLNSKPGDSVFINGGTGGVGHFAIQFAKAHGCRVTVSCSTSKVNFCKDLGADDVIDYRTEDLVLALKKRGKVFNLVVDYAYREEVGLYRVSSDFIAPDGKYVMIPGGVTAGIMKTIAKNMFCPSMLGGGKAKFEVYFAKSNRAALEQIAQWMATGQVRTVIDTAFDFPDMPRAIEKIKSSTATGKLVVRV